MGTAARSEVVLIAATIGSGGEGEGGESWDGARRREEARREG
jgi:hypothetical protein